MLPTTLPSNYQNKIEFNGIDIESTNSDLY
jgi:hypothetical protein